MAGRKTEYGSGPLFKAAGTVYGVMVCAALLVLANVYVVLLPLLAGLVGPVALLGFVLVGPAVVASCYAFNRLPAGEDTGVFHDFVKSYRDNFGQALVVWLPYMLLLGAIAFNLAVLPGTSSPGSTGGTDPVQLAARIGLVGLALMVCTTAMNAMLLLSRFAFRTRDIHRLSVYTLGVQRRVSLGNAGILFVTAFVLVMTTAWLALFVAGLVLYLVCLNSRPLLAAVEAKFTVAGGPSVAG
ncbi:YesL family protein [Paenarthrobacter aurescens]|uniref:YesL family protein n=1 Tax=Paenarthrobacter aurescens TaxID=43663 RepID=UPI0021BE4962|nr:YesL family protein [Paenarthrobacter aurescens]MCT9868679.1 YesL family protein [Paenarthrobacter aurescens]